MAKKRRKGKKPNLPQATIDRARRQAGVDEDDIQDDIEETVDAQADEEIEDVEDEATESHSGGNSRRAERAAERARRRARAARSRDAVRVSSMGPSRRKNKDDDLDNSMMAQLLANPTKIVSQEQLQEEYGYVLRDLRNMFILAIVLMVALVLLAQFI